MKKLIKAASLIVTVLTISSCAEFSFSKKEVRNLDYLDKSVKMDFKKFFDGDLEGFAIKQDSAGKIIETFTTKINGKWEENRGVLQFSYRGSDSAKSSRTWLITTNADGSFEGVGHDAIKSLVGKQEGNAAQMIYSLNIKDSKGLKEEFGFEDKIYLVDEKSAIIISEFQSKKSSKGAAGKIILSIKKTSAQQ
ncbi:MAG: DUF3833 family protein [Proteobacteria bacterium]|nr:DUF3833 family protein [Pseudomonadota bacterium]